MTTFHHAESCRCGNCQPTPPAGAYPDDGAPGEPLCPLDCYSGKPGCRCDAREAELLGMPVESDELDPARVCDCPDPCGCYTDGYADGRDKAHFETRAVLDGNHADGCGCEPCITVRAVLDAANRRATETARAKRTYGEWLGQQPAPPPAAYAGDALDGDHV